MKQYVRGFLSPGMTRKGVKKGTPKKDARCPPGPVSPAEFWSRHCRRVWKWNLFDRGKAAFPPVKYRKKTEKKPFSTSALP